MEKVIVALWPAEAEPLEAFNAQLKSRLVPALETCGARSLRLNLQDERVAAGAGLRQMNADPPIGAAVQFWLPTANELFRAEIDACLARYSGRYAAWLAVESTIIANTAHPPPAAGPTWGFAQLAWLQVPPRLSREEWLTIWRRDHTRVAIDTQANFEYVHNLFVSPLTEKSPPFAAMVEECFPATALTDPQVFFDAVGDPKRYDANLAAMMESCARFIDFDRIDVMITSQYGPRPG